MLRRRRRESGDQPGAYAESLEAGHQPGGRMAGPWDIADDFPEGMRIDCGSLLVPLREGFDVQIEEQGAWVAVVHGESGMQLQAFAAPRTGGLWDEVRHEMAVSIADSGGSCQEGAGPAGPELEARVPVGEDDGGIGLLNQLQPVRFLGFDGPRWFLRGVITGPAANDAATGAPFGDLFTDVVVVRGDYPAPPRDQLEIRLPEEARQALEELDDEDPGWQLQDPFTRGPEITETR